MNHPGKLCFLMALATGSLAAQGRAPATNWLGNLTFTAAGTISQVDNISRTSAEPFRQDATTYEVSLAASKPRQLAPSWLLQLGANAALVAVPDFDRTNRFEAGPHVSLQHKFGLGPLAPVLQADFAASYKSARLAVDRGWSTKAGLRLAKRFTSALKAGLATEWFEHNARSAVFDLNQQSFSFDATWDISERWSLSGSAGRLSGDIVANAAWAVWGQAISGGFGPTIFNYYTSRPWAVTDLYGAGWVSYNVEADVDLWSGALTYALSGRTSAEFRYSSAFVVNKIGIRYPTDSWGLSVVHRF